MTPDSPFANMTRSIAPVRDAAPAPPAFVVDFVVQDPMVILAMEQGVTVEELHTDFANGYYANPDNEAVLDAELDSLIEARAAGRDR